MRLRLQCGRAGVGAALWRAPFMHPRNPHTARPPHPSPWFLPHSNLANNNMEGEVPALPNVSL